MYRMIANKEQYADLLASLVESGDITEGEVIERLKDFDKRQVDGLVEFTEEGGNE